LGNRDSECVHRQPDCNAEYGDEFCQVHNFLILA
jgi:hypothetical protein